MEATAKEVVLFYDTLDDNADKHFGILFNNGYILCLCCGAYVEPEDYVILKHYNWISIDETLLKNYQK